MKDEAKKEYWPNGQQKYSWAQLNGRDHGIQVGWRKDGKIEYLCLMLNGRFHGLYQNWLHNGTRFLIYINKNDQEHGSSIYFKYGSLNLEIQEWKNNTPVQ